MKGATKLVIINGLCLDTIEHGDKASPVIMNLVNFGFDDTIADGTLTIYTNEQYADYTKKTVIYVDEQDNIIDHHFIGK